MKGMKEYRELTEKLYKVPESVQQLIPVHKIAEDGIFLLENKPDGAEVLFDKAYLFLDTNFATMDDTEKDDFLRQYCMLLNSMSVSFKVIVINNNQDLAGVHQQICIRERDGEFRDMIRSFNAYIEDCVMRGQAGLKQVRLPSFNLPASIGPPDTNMVGTFTRAAAIKRPGTFLSQFGTQTMASN